MRGFQGARSSMSHLYPIPWARIGHMIDPSLGSDQSLEGAAQIYQRKVMTGPELGNQRKLYLTFRPFKGTCFGVDESERMWQVWVDGDRLRDSPSHPICQGTVSQSRGPGLEERQVQQRTTWSLEPHVHSWCASKYGDKTLLEIQFCFKNIIFQKKKPLGPPTALSPFIFLRKLIFKNECVLIGTFMGWFIHGMTGLASELPGYS